MTLAWLRDPRSRWWEAAGYRDAGIMASQLQTMLFGAISMAVARRTSASAIAARDAARNMLECAVRTEPPSR